MAHSFRTLPPLEAITAALAARELGSFTAAAEALNVTHTAVSRRVAVAEHWAGGAIFERHGRGVRTTVEGERLLARLDGMLDGIDRLVDRDRAAPRRRRVRVATTPSFAVHRLLPVLRDLEADDLGIEIVADARNADLRRVEIDLAFRYGRGGWRMGEEIALPRPALVPVFHGDLANDSMNDAEAIATLPFVHDADTTLWRAWCGAHGLTRRAKGADRILFDHISAVAAAEAGLGAALFDPALRPGSAVGATLCVADDLPLENPPLGYFAVVPSGGNDDARVILERLGVG